MPMEDGGVDFGSDDELTQFDKHVNEENDNAVELGSNAMELEEEAPVKQEVLLHFCSQCANMLYPFEDRANKKLLLVCRNCGNRKAADNDCVYRNELIKDTKMKLSQVNDDCINDVTLQRTGNANCETCGGSEAVFFMTHDDTMKIVSVCRSCRNKWIA
eukprot:g4561.t1